MNSWISLAAALAVLLGAPFGYSLSALSTPEITHSPAPASAEVSVLSSDHDLNAQVDAWIDELAKEKAFADWQGAVWSKKPLGPGQHGWVVFVQSESDGRTLGYLIIGAKPEGGYELLEYGAGEFTLFSPAALEGALESGVHDGVAFTEDASIELHYYDALHAFWKVTEAGESRYADAANGAWLPIDEDDVSRLKVGTFSKQALPGKRLHIIVEPGDPYMSIAWLDAPDADVDDWQSFAAWLDHHRDGEAVYAGSAYGGKILAPAGVAGYHWWHAAGAAALEGYVALDQEGLARYVPLETLLHSGAFR